MSQVRPAERQAELCGSGGQVGVAVEAVPKRGHARYRAKNGRDERHLPIPVSEGKQPGVEVSFVSHPAAIKPHLEEETVNTWLHSAQICQKDTGR